MAGHARCSRSSTRRRSCASWPASPSSSHAPPAVDEDLKAKLNKRLGKHLEKAIYNPDKAGREEAPERAAQRRWSREFVEQGYDPKAVGKLFESLEKDLVRREDPEGRQAARRPRPEGDPPISVEVGVLPRAHGSGLFTRGQTQVLSVATLGTEADEQSVDSIGLDEPKRYMHHYNFPPFSVGEARPLRGPSRRDIGHGALAERRWWRCCPTKPEFPYVIRVVSDTLCPRTARRSMGSDLRQHAGAAWTRACRSRRRSRAWRWA